MAEILVLDDVLDAVVLLQKILERNGHVVHPFTEEAKAIAYATQHPVDLAILDLKLQKMNGIEVLRQLKNDNPLIKAIMLTGYPTIETVQNALELGAAEYCVKPIDRRELEEKVNRVLGG